jgi:hypothetical protein
VAAGGQAGQYPGNLTLAWSEVPEGTVVEVGVAAGGMEAFVALVGVGMEGVGVVGLEALAVAAVPQASINTLTGVMGRLLLHSP